MNVSLCNLTKDRNVVGGVIVFIYFLAYFIPTIFQGNRYALTVICMFTGFTICIPLPDKKAQTILKTVHTGKILFYFH